MALLRSVLMFGLLAACGYATAAEGLPAPVSQTSGSIGVPSNVGKIIARRVVGAVAAQDKATRVAKPVRDDMLLKPGQVITTGPNSSVVLVLTNGAMVNISPESSLEIADFSQDPYAGSHNVDTMTDEPSRSLTKLILTRGQIVGKVPRLQTAGGSSFVVQESTSPELGLLHFLGNLLRFFRAELGSSKTTEVKGGDFRFTVP